MNWACKLKTWVSKINQRSEKRDEMAMHTRNPSTPGVNVGRWRVWCLSELYGKVQASLSDIARLCCNSGGHCQVKKRATEKHSKSDF